MTFKPELIPKGCNYDNYLLKDTYSASTIYETSFIKTAFYPLLNKSLRPLHLSVFAWNFPMRELLPHKRR